MHTINLRMP